jgi:predicted nucleic acid-binding protein
MKLVIDTSVLIDYLRGGSRWEELLSKFEKSDELYLPTIVIFELFSGSSTSNLEISRKITDFLKYFQKVDLTEKIAKRAGVLFRDVNKNLGASDYIIAASTLELGATLVTLNIKHFGQITNLSLYPI